LTPIAASLSKEEMVKLCLACGFVDDQTAPPVIQCPLCKRVHTEYEASIADEAHRAGQTLNDYAAGLRREAALYHSRAGFVGATLVHTREGLRRIDSLREGDSVLAQSGEDGPRAHARIRRVAELVAADIMCVAYMEPGVKKFRLFATSAQAFWVRGDGWTPASRLQGDWVGPSLLPSLGGSVLHCDPYHVYRTPWPHIGWIGSGQLEGEGLTWDFSAESFVRCESFDIHHWPLTVDGSAALAFTAVVHHIDIENHDSYFVGDHGLRVLHAAA
jgi:hypothetical protein